MDTVIKAQATSENADNDLQRGAALAARNQDMCKFLAGKRVTNWAGKVSDLDSTGDGYGVVSVEIAENIRISTWNNSFSDFEDRTLIKPSSLLNDALKLEVGQPVTFSGHLMSGGGICVNDRRLTLTEKLNDPDFVLKFTSITGR